jgi:hypothetical protein
MFMRYVCTCYFLCPYTYVNIFLTTHALGSTYLCRKGIIISSKLHILLLFAESDILTFINPQQTTLALYLFKSDFIIKKGIVSNSLRYKKRSATGMWVAFLCISASSKFQPPKLLEPPLTAWWLPPPPPTTNSQRVQQSAYCASQSLALSKGEQNQFINSSITTITINQLHNAVNKSPKCLTLQKK